MKVAPAGNRPAADTEFSNGQGAALLNPGGTHVALSARPDALWGGSPGHSSDEPAQIAALPPADRAAKLAELQVRRDEMQAKILVRVTELEKKWEAAPTATKAAALREYLETSQQLDPATRRQLRGKVEQAEDCHQRIDALRGKRDGLPPARRANAEMRARRGELNRELRAARKDEKVAVKEATKVVDDAGLKVDRLAVTEQVIDPSAPKATSDNSLLGMLKSFFTLNWLTSWVHMLVDKATEDLSEKKSTERADVLARDLDNQQVQQRLVANREALKLLAAATRKAG